MKSLNYLFLLYDLGWLNSEVEQQCIWTIEIILPSCLFRMCAFKSFFSCDLSVPFYYSFVHLSGTPQCLFWNKEVWELDKLCKLS